MKRPGLHTDGNLSHPLMRDPYIELTLEQIRAAQRTVAEHAWTTDDCRLLLDMLGLLP